MINQPKRKFGFDIPEMVPCEDFTTDDPKRYKYERSGCLGCEFSHEFYWKDNENSMISGYSRVSGPNCEFGKLTKGKYGEKVEVGDYEPHPTAVVSLQQVEKIESWLCHKTISKKAIYKDMGEIMYRIAEVPQVATMKKGLIGYDEEVPIEELKVFRDSILAEDKEFENFRSLGGYGLSQDSFTKLRKKGKTIEEIVELFK
jgi:hypothetical protein